MSLSKLRILDAVEMKKKKKLYLCQSRSRNISIHFSESDKWVADEVRATGKRLHISPGQVFIGLAKATFKHKKPNEKV